MITGAFGQSAVQQLKTTFDSIGNQMGGDPPSCVGTNDFQVCVDLENSWVSDDSRRFIGWTGTIFEYDGSKTDQDPEKMAALSEAVFRHGSESFKKINGSSVISTWDQNNRTGHISRDKLGIHQVFYCPFAEGLLFSSRLRTLVAILPGSTDLHIPALLRFLTFCYNPGEETFFSGIRKLRPSHYIRWEREKFTIEPYWKIEFNIHDGSDESALTSEIRERLYSAVKIRMNTEKPTGIFLSGGLDSSGVASLLSREGVRDLRSFSFRCAGESFDESSYAKIVADTFGTQHTLIDYRPEDVLTAKDFVPQMDEPFCDVGINIATYLLGKSAATEVVDVFTGDGGDELFGGHPVYLADRVARIVDAVPGFLVSPFIHFGKRLRDSDQKKDWRVKLGRFSRSFAFPAALGTHRWRVYYNNDELKRLFHPGIINEDDLDGVFSDMISFNRETDAAESLSRSLYSDYQTVVQFYLRRLELIETMGLKPRFPLLDPEVVAFCATVPAKYKIRGSSDTKYIEKRVLEPWLPHEIVYRKDKLGHSIPLKNWMRENPVVQDFMYDLLSPQALNKQGFFDPASVREMMDGHQSRRHNHSHRLWALMVLQLWLNHGRDNWK